MAHVAHYQDTMPKIEHKLKWNLCACEWLKLSEHNTSDTMKFVFE